MSKIDILGPYWTLAVGANPAAQSPSEKHCPHGFQERVEAAANAGYTGMGFWHDDLFKRREGIGFDEMKTILDANGIADIEIEWLLGWFYTDERRAELSRLDIVFANAGIAAGKGYVGDPDREHQPDGQIDTTDLQPWEDLININLSGVHYTLRHAARIMKSQNKKGSIIVTTSNASTITVPIVAAPDMATKTGAAHLVRQIARELAEFGIR